MLTIPVDYHLTSVSIILIYSRQFGFFAESIIQLLGVAAEHFRHLEKDVGLVKVPDE